jgi:hypothetical protein
VFAVSEFGGEANDPNTQFANGTLFGLIGGVCAVIVVVIVFIIVHQHKRTSERTKGHISGEMETENERTGNTLDSLRLEETFLTLVNFENPETLNDLWTAPMMDTLVTAEVPWE